MIELRHSMPHHDDGKGVNIINPAHIVNVMSNDVELPNVTVEFITHTALINFKSHNDRVRFLYALREGDKAVIEIDTLHNTHSRWSKGELHD